MLKEKIDVLAEELNFGSDRKQSFDSILEIAGAMGARFASTENLYRAMAAGKVSGFTVPAINIRTLTYDTARLIFDLMKKQNTCPVILKSPSRSRAIPASRHWFTPVR